MKTSDSKQRYNFERHDRVFSRGGYHVFHTSGLSSACKLQITKDERQTIFKSTYLHKENCQTSDNRKYSAITTKQIQVWLGSPACKKTGTITMPCMHVCVQQAQEIFTNLFKKVLSW